MTPWLATEADIPALVEMGRRFHAMSPHKPVGDYDGAAVERVLRFLMTNPDGIVLTNGEGMIAGLIAPVFFAPTIRMGEESSWWAEKGGKELLEAFEEETVKRGGNCAMVSTLAGDREPPIERIMRRAGYLPIERRWMKAL